MFRRNSPINQLVGQVLRDLRISKGLTQTVNHPVRELVRIDQPNLSKLELGKNSPTLDTLVDRLEDLEAELHLVVIHQGREFARVTPTEVIYAEQKAAG